MIWYFTLTQRRKMIEIFDLPSILAASPLQCCVIYLYSIGEDPRGHEESCLFSRNSTKLHIAHAMTLRQKRFLILAHLLASFGNFVGERQTSHMKTFNNGSINGQLTFNDLMRITEVSAIIKLPKTDLKKMASFYRIRLLSSHCYTLVRGSHNN